MEIEQAAELLRAQAEYDATFCCTVTAPIRVGAERRARETAIRMVLAELSRLKAEVATLRQERDTLVEMWPQHGEGTCVSPCGRTWWTIAGGKTQEFTNREEAVRFAAGLPERGSDG